MLRVDLVALERAGSIALKGVVSQSDPLWTDSGLRLLEPVHVDLRASLSATGQVLVRGQVTARVQQECRRCLDSVELAVDLPIEWVWDVPDEFGDADGEIRLLDPVATDLETGGALREELILAVPMYVECRKDCLGLCPKCGQNRNLEPCDCVMDEPDPRWDALRSLKNE